ncbi:MAG: ATP-binding cassette domain-containing protein [Bacteroidota bacterium]
MEDDLIIRIQEESAEIKKLIAQARNEEAITRLLDFGSGFSFMKRSIQNDATRLSSRYYQYVEEKTQGIISEENREIKLNKIKRDILDYLDKTVDRFIPNTENIDHSSLSEEEKNEIKFYRDIEQKKKENPNYDIVFQGNRISKSFKNNVHFKLENIDITLKLGEITGITGKNAAGKTTLLNIIAGSLRMDSGTFSYPHLTLEKSSWQHIKNQIAYIPATLKPWHGRLKDTLHFHTALKGLKGKENREQVDWILHRLQIAKYKDYFWHEISSGYQMRFALAKALVWNPKLLIMDEPLAFLDIEAQFNFLQDLKKISKNPTYSLSIVLSSQHIHAIEEVCSQLYFFVDGDLKFRGSLSDLADPSSNQMYEFSVRENRDKTIEILAQAMWIESHQITGRTFQIETENYVTSDMVLDQLKRNLLTITYFRDITNSGKKLF